MRSAFAAVFALAFLLAFLTRTPDARAGEPEPVVFPVRIDTIKIEGLTRSIPKVVRRELGFTEGDVITKEQLDFAITRLWNTTIFAQVKGEVVRDGAGRHVALFEIEDRWTLNVLFSFGSGGSANYFRVGAFDNNLAGRFLELQGQYENFDGFHGGQMIFRNPRLFDQRLELSVHVERLVRPRPGFSDQKSQAIVEVLKLAMADRLRFGLRVSGFADRFLAPLDPPSYYPLPTETLLLEPRFRIGRIDTVRLRQTGTSLEVRPGVGFTTSDVASRYTSMTGEVLSFIMVGERLNFGFRARAATMSEVPEHLQMYAGGLDLIRGLPDNYVRTNVMALANVEARLVAFDSTWVALMPAVFADAIAARGTDGTARTTASVGAGLRILIPKFVGSGLRADLAIPLHANFERAASVGKPFNSPPVQRADVLSLQPSFGVYQFF